MFGVKRLNLSSDGGSGKTFFQRERERERGRNVVKSTYGKRMGNFECPLYVTFNNEGASKLFPIKIIQFDVTPIKYV